VLGYFKVKLKFAFLRIICLIQQTDLTKSMKVYNFRRLDLLIISKISFFSNRSEMSLPSGQQRTNILQSALSKCFLSFMFTDLNYSFLILWPIKRQVSTFQKFVCKVLTVFGKKDENCVGMSEYNISLLGFHTSHSLIKCMFLVKILCFWKGFFLFSLAETVVSLIMGGIF
jgi:hypothetical protein